MQVHAVFGAYHIHADGLIDSKEKFEFD